MALTSVLPQLQEQRGAIPALGPSLLPPNGGDRGMSRGGDPLANNEMTSRSIFSNMAERLRSPWRRDGVLSPKWEPGAPRPWRRGKHNDTAETVSTTLPSTAEPMSAMQSPRTRPATALTLPPATPRREAYEEDMQDDNSQDDLSQSTIFSFKCPPGCLDPTISRKIGPSFTRMPKQRHKRKLDPIHRLPKEEALPSIASDAGSPPDDLSPSIKAEPTPVQGSAPDSQDELPGNGQSPRLTDGTKTPRQEVIEPEDEVRSTTSRGVTSTTSFDAKPPAMVNEAITSLLRPTAVWQPELWLEARNAVVESKRVLGLSGLFQCVRQSTDRVLQKQTYQIRTKVRHSMGVVDMSNTLSQVRKVHWFGRQNVDVPDALGELEAGGAGKCMPPPLIICDESPLEVLHKVRKVLGHNRPIVLVAELSDFDESGAAIRLGHHRSMNPDCLPLRSDFNRFVDEAGVHLQSASATMKQHLCAQNDPYVFLCPGVTVFRGSRDEGFCFLPEPHQAHVVAASMHNTRPAIQTVNSREGGSVWYAYRSDHTALLERYNLIGLVGLQAAPYAGRAELVENGIRHENEDELPVLIVTALGCGNQGKHPRDAVASILKSWRRRFAPFYHSVYVCCAGHGGGADTGLASFIDEVVNKSLYRILEVDPVAADLVASKAMRWHWDSQALKLSCSRSKMEKAAHICRRAAEVTKGSVMQRRRMTPSSIIAPSSRGTVPDTESQDFTTNSFKPMPMDQQDSPSGKSVGKVGLTKRTSMFSDSLAGPLSAHRRETAHRQTLSKQDFGQELTNMLKGFSVAEDEPAASREGSPGSEDSSSSDELPPENAPIGIQIQRSETPPQETGADMTAADMLKALHHGWNNPSESSGSRRSSKLIGGMIGNWNGSRRSSRMDAAQVNIGRRTSKLSDSLGPGHRSKTLKGGIHEDGRSASPSISSTSYLSSLQLAGGLRNLCHQHTDRPRTPGDDASSHGHGKKKRRPSVLKKSQTLKTKGGKDLKDTDAESVAELTEEEPTEDDSATEEPNPPAGSLANLPTVQEGDYPCQFSSSDHGDSPFGSRQPSPVLEEQEDDEIQGRNASKQSALSDCDPRRPGSNEVVRRRLSDPCVSEAAKAASAAADSPQQGRRASISRRKEDLLKNRDLPESVQQRGRRGSTGCIQEHVRRLSLDLCSPKGMSALLLATEELSHKKGEVDKEARKDLYHKMMRRRSSLKGQAPTIKNALGLDTNDYQVSTLREGIKARRNSFSGSLSPTSPTSPGQNTGPQVINHEEERKRMRDLLMKASPKSVSGAASNSSQATPTGGTRGLAARLESNARRNSLDRTFGRSPSKERLTRSPSKESTPRRTPLEPSPRRGSAEVVRRSSQERQIPSSADPRDEGAAKKAVQLSIKESVEKSSVPAPVLTGRKGSKEKRTMEDQVNTLAQQMEATLDQFRQKSSGSGPSTGSRFRSSMADELDAPGGQEALSAALSARKGPSMIMQRGSIQEVKAAGAVRSSIRGSIAHASTRGSVGGASSHSRSSVGTAGPAVEAEDASRVSPGTDSRSSTSRDHSHEHVHFSGGDDLRHRMSEHKRRKKGDSLLLRMQATSSIRGQEEPDDEDGDPRSSRLMSATARRTSALQTGVVGPRNLHF